ncbi:phosphomannomutase [Methylophilus rhizosphaerae]|uniref:Phosphomannomutase n=1 Tax=Methylophilus rhizosphaerae TaxID=492660 RepID=A0A1G8YZV6_9PROT|nr:phosphomannomutase [Methylophilus rhizosphaerae]SDK08419.1 phosphomannomutase [Methylophilus rhizosphaerae]
MRVLRTVMQQSGVAFGTSGARGLVSAMSDEVCAAYIQAFVCTVKTAFTFSQVAIAMDLRPSSPAIAEACAKMLCQLGLEVIFCGAIPTPALALFAQTRRIPGIMVTGSHIPFDRNGLKFYRPDGEITKSDETDMLACALQPLAETAISLPAEDMQAREAYIQRYTSLLGEQALAGLKLAIYQHSSVGRDLMHRLLTELGAEVVCLARSDTFVPIDTEAVSMEDRQRGLDWAAKYQVDAIISTDGDGDRPLISDEKGQWLRGDIVGLLTAKALQVTHLAVPVSCNTAIEASGFFRQVMRTRIGSPFVIAGMQALQQSGASSVAGFEANGGFLLGSHVPQTAGLAPLPTRDAVLPIVILLSQVKTQDKPLSQLVAALPQRFTASDRLQSFPTESSQALLTRWTADPAGLQQALQLPAHIVQMDTTDGLRAELASAQVVHLRPSGNAPEFRCYVEDVSQAAAQSLLSHVMQQLKAFA